MLRTMMRHTVVGVTLAAVGGIAMANTLGYVGGRTGHAEIEYLETRPVLTGDLGEIVVRATPERAR